MEKESEILRAVGRIVVGGYYDFQEVRIGSMNRIRDVLRKVNEGIDLSKPEEKKPEEQKYLKDYTDEKIPKLLDKMLNEGKLTGEEKDYLSKSLRAFKDMKGAEKRHTLLMMEYLSKTPLWNDWLRKIKGISSVLGSGLIKNFGYCETYNHVSNLWSHCGLHVVEGEAVKKTKGEKLHFNPRLRALAWKIADSFVKKRTAPYRGIYDGEKARQRELMNNGADNAPKNRMHADLRARRKMIKIFLQHYWVVARTMKGLPTEGLPTEMPYAQDRMGHKSYIPPPSIDMDSLKPLTF